MGIITIHQPEHMPWLGYFNKMLKADTFIILDSVQFEKNNYQNRNRILTKNGSMWLTVPVEMKGHTGCTIQDIKIANTLQPTWRKKYLTSIKNAYSKHPYFDEIYPEVERIVDENSSFICDLNIALILFFANKLHSTCSFVRSSDMQTNGMKSDLVLDICKQTNADIYISGSGGREYMDLKSFEHAGIKVSFNDYKHPNYIQKNSKEFVPYMSVLDLLMNVSADEARNIILSGLPDVNF